MRNPRIPTYRRHKQSGQAIVTLPNGFGGRRDVLLGTYNSAASKKEYRRVLTEWEAQERRLASSPEASDLRISELILAYWRHAERYYRDPSGRPTTEVPNVKQALRRIKLLYGSCPVAEFDGLKLVTVREQMIQEGLARKRINRDVARMKRMFKWGASQNLVPIQVHQKLTTVEGLRFGRSAAKESAPVRPVSAALVSQTLPHLRPQVAAMVQLQLLAGMRPGEVVIMRSMDLDTSGKVWLYRPGSDLLHGAHKTAWRGQDRVIALGPRAQLVLREWLRTNLQEYLFQPAEARAQQDADRRRNRMSPMTPSHEKRRSKAWKKSSRGPGGRYTRTSYTRAIARGCELAFPFPYPAGLAKEKKLEWEMKHEEEISRWRKDHHWHPSQLRHTRATEVRRQFGLDAARALLGHRSPAVTEIYAELDLSKAAQVMEEVG